MVGAAARVQVKFKPHAASAKSSFIYSFFPLESVMWSLLNALGHVSDSRGFESFS